MAVIQVAQPKSVLGGQGRIFQGVRYPAPWFDIANTFLPPNIASLIRWCRFYSNSHPIAGVLRKMAMYPITDFIYEGPTEELRETYRDVLDEVLDLKSVLVAAGIDYYTFGNSFVTLYEPFTRFLVCNSCKHKMRIKKVQYEFKNFVFSGKCQKCKTEGPMDVSDVPLKNYRKLRVIRWEPETISIMHNPMTGRNIYMYKIPTQIRANLKKGSKFLLEDTPNIFLKAARAGHPVQFNDTKLFHFKRPTMAGKDMGWGEPIIQPVLKYLFYLQILMKAREASAQQGINPLRILFPTSNNGLNAFENLNLGKWRRQVEREIFSWRQDPNHVSVMPIAMGYQAVGGEHGNVNTTPEVQQLMDDIIAGMQIPKSFYYGGAPYSGTSAEFRMLENQFIAFQKQCLRMINSFVIPIVKRLMDIPSIRVTFTDMRVADDVQKKQLLLNLNAQRPKKISDTTVMSEFGLDADKEKEKILEEKKRDFEDAADELEAQAKAQGRADLVSIRNQIKGQVIAQIEQARILEELKKEGYSEEEIMLALGQQHAAGPPLMEEGAAADLSQGAGPSNDEVLRLIKVLDGLPAAQKEHQIKQLEQNDPTLFRALMAQQSPEGSPPPNLGREASQVDMRPLPPQKPPTRSAPPV